jgi:hypothetical protein
MNKTEITKEIMKAVTKNNNEKYKWQHFIAKDVAMFYPNIAKAKDWGDNTTPKYGLTIVIPQEDKTAIESITNSYNTISEKFKLNLLDYTYTNKFKNGNEYNEERLIAGKKANNLYTNRYFLQMSSQFPLVIVNTQREQVKVHEDFDTENNGRIINLKYGLKPYWNNTQRVFGIVCIPVAIQILEKGLATFAPSNKSVYDGFEFSTIGEKGEENQFDLPFM